MHPLLSYNRNNRITTEGAVLLGKGLAASESLKHLKVTATVINIIINCNTTQQGIPFSLTTVSL